LSKAWTRKKDKGKPDDETGCSNTKRTCPGNGSGGTKSKTEGGRIGEKKRNIQLKTQTVVKREEKRSKKKI